MCCPGEVSPAVWGLSVSAQCQGLVPVCSTQGRVLSTIRRGETPWVPVPKRVRGVLGSLAGFPGVSEYTCSLETLSLRLAPLTPHLLITSLFEFYPTPFHKGTWSSSPPHTVSKKAECRRTDAFELWCWRGLLRVPWTARRSNQSVLKEMNPECSLQGLMLTLNLQYFSHLMWRANSLEKTLMLGKIEGRRRRGRQIEMVGWHHWIKGHEFEQTPGGSEGQGSRACCSHGVTKSRTRPSNWTTAVSKLILFPLPKTPFLHSSPASTSASLSHFSVPAWVKDPSGFPRNPQQAVLIAFSTVDWLHLSLVCLLWWCRLPGGKDLLPQFLSAHCCTCT